MSIGVKSTKKNVIIFGLGSFANLMYYYLTNDSEYNVVAFSADRKYCNNQEFNGLPVVAFEELEKHFPPEKFYMILAVGYTKLNGVRSEKYFEAKKKGYSLISYISSRASWCIGSEIGDNCIIMENAIIQPFVKLGNNIIIWSGAILAHNAHIGDHCFIAAGSVIAGNTTIGSRSFLGINATVKDGIKIGEACIIGAGVNMLKSADDNTVFIEKEAVCAPFSSSRFYHFL